MRKSDTSTTRRKTRRSAITPKSIQNNRDLETDPDAPRARISTPPECLDLASDNSLDKSPVDFTTYQSSNQSFDQSEISSLAAKLETFPFLDIPLAFQTTSTPFPPSQSSVDTFKLREPRVLTS